MAVGDEKTEEGDFTVYDLDESRQHSHWCQAQLRHLYKREKRGRIAFGDAHTWWNITGNKGQI